jgi:hypothetical protein
MVKISMKYATFEVINQFIDIVSYNIDNQPMNIKCVLRGALDA